MSETTARWYAEVGDLEADLRRHARIAAGSYADRIDLGQVSCAAPTLRLLRTLHGIERSTIARMRVLLVTPTHSDAQVTAFLCTWAYERHWIAEALSAVLHQHGWAADFTPDSTSAPRRLITGLRHRLLPITEALRTNLIGDPVVATHLVQGVLDEALTRSAYRRLADLEPSLAGLAEEVLGTKLNHGRYLWTRAADDLGRSAAARRLVRRDLRRHVWPPAGPELPVDEVAWFVRTLFGREVDRRQADLDLAALPSLAVFRTVLAGSRVAIRSGRARRVTPETRGDLWPEQES